MTKKIALVGSQTFPIDTATGTEIVNVIRGFGEDVVILTRGAEGFDRFVMQVAPIIGVRCFAYPSSGGADNWLRDLEIVKDADEILAFLDPDSLHDPNTGTAHLLECALRAEKPTRAYTALHGSLVWAGETQEEPTP
jgi:hypothetical protein